MKREQGVPFQQKKEREEELAVPSFQKEEIWFQLS